MKTPFLCIATNTYTSLIFSDKNNVVNFAAMVADQLSDLLNVISTTTADEGFVKGAMATAIDLSFQLEQATGALRDGPDGHQDTDWLPQTRPPEDHQSRDVPPESASAEVHTDVAQDFIEGKALAALLAVRSASYHDGDLSALPAGYRSEDEYVEQDNYSRDIIARVMKDPRLLDGFSAGLTQYLSDNTESANAIPLANWMASLSYEACRTKFGDMDERDAYTAPPLSQQLEAMGIVPPAPVQPGVTAAPPSVPKPNARRRGKAVAA
jgi:hypothetical protein